MTDYISRNEALENWPLCDEPVDAYQYIKNLPAADVQPVVHGTWVGIDDFPHEDWECDHCGADMREPPKEET